MLITVQFLPDSDAAIFVTKLKNNNIAVVNSVNFDHRYIIEFKTNKYSSVLSFVDSKASVWI